MHTITFSPDCNLDPVKLRVYANESKVILSREAPLQFLHSTFKIQGPNDNIDCFLNMIIRDRPDVEILVDGSSDGSRQIQLQ